MEQKYNDFSDCPICNRETLHEYYSTGHERDSSGDYRRCKVCNSIDMGLTGYYWENATDMVEIVENPEYDIRFPKFIILTYIGVAIFLILKAKNIF